MSRLWQGPSSQCQFGCSGHYNVWMGCKSSPHFQLFGTLKEGSSQAFIYCSLPSYKKIKRPTPSAWCHDPPSRLGCGQICDLLSCCQQPPPDTLYHCLGIKSFSHFTKMKYLLRFISGKFSFLLLSPDFSMEKSQIGASKLCSEDLWIFYVIQKFRCLLCLSQLAYILLIANNSLIQVGLLQYHCQ